MRLMPKAPTPAVVTPASRTVPSRRVRRLQPDRRTAGPADAAASWNSGGTGSNTGSCMSSIGASLLPAKGASSLALSAVPGRDGTEPSERGEEGGDPVVVVGAGDV